MNKILLIILCASFLGCKPNCDANTSVPVDIYYVKIGVETFMPVTIDNINHNFQKHLTVPQCSDIVTYIDEVASNTKKGKFSDRRVRVLIVWPDGRKIFIDNDGGVFDGKVSRSISHDALNDIREMIERED